MASRFVNDDRSQDAFEAIPYSDGRPRRLLVEMLAHRKRAQPSFAVTCGSGKRLTPTLFARLAEDLGPGDRQGPEA